MANEGSVPLADFADLHGISRNEALRMWREGHIKGVKDVPGRRGRVIIGPKGKRDAWVQFHVMPGYRACDDCPHEQKA